MSGESISILDRLNRLSTDLHMGEDIHNGKEGEHRDYINQVDEIRVLVNELKTCQRPHVGIAAFIEKDGKYLLLKRSRLPGICTWGCPGGKLERFEDIGESITREVKEEVGLDIRNIEIDRITNDKFMEDGFHYVTIFVTCDWTGEPKNMEPEKHSEMGWFELDKKEDLFLPLINYLL